VSVVRSPRKFARVLVPLALAASFAPAGAIDLSQAYRAALDNDSTIRAARAAANARRERLPQSRAQLLPQVAISSSRFRNILDQRQPNLLGQQVENHQVYTSANDTLQMRQPIFRAALWADYRQAQAIVDDANATLDKEEQNLVVRVGGAYFEALLAEDQLQLVQSQKTAYLTQLDAARKRMAAGAGTRTDIDEAQARLDMTIAQELELKQAVDLSRRQLEALVEMPLGKLATLDAAALRLARPEPESVEPWTETAVANSPEIRALRAQAEAARYEVLKARAGHLPTLDAVAQVSRSESDTITNINQRNNVKAIGVQLNVPIFSGGYVNSQVRQALAEQERIDNALEGTRRDLAVRVHREFRGVTEGVLKVQALEQAVRSAQQAVTSSRRSFEAGARTLVDILNAEQQYATAVRDLSQARYVYLISRVRLQALAGGAKSAVLDEINAWLKP
jgi:outer membrane protein, protease secretion system